ncbi:MAG: Electron transport complex protein RnfD [Firmicutes bacterium ADurb.Bin182]|nr:MAG: Electron transport complex protein RnfD [Firmicutes bacterium ADurb.Bin182]
MNLRISPAPHIRSAVSTRSLMLDVVIALIPTTAAGIYFFGLNAAVTVALSVAAAVISEYLYQKIRKQEPRINDLSAVVTGLILGLNLPPSAPWWLPVVGSAIAIVIVKQLFGGIGDNFLNPAMAARGILLASWSLRMTTFYAPTYFKNVDAVTTATPLSAAASAAEATSSATGAAPAYQMPSLTDLFLGNMPGSIGEVCKAAILLGLIYLVIRKVITVIPFVMMISFALFTWIFGGDPLTGLLTGGVMFGAVFMATDYSSSPMTIKGQMIYAAIIGFIIVILRKYGSYPEGVTYAILLGNIAAPLIDKYSKLRVYGEVKPNA